MEDLKQWMYDGISAYDVIFILLSVFWVLGGRLSRITTRIRSLGLLKPTVPRCHRNIERTTKSSGNRKLSLFLYGFLSLLVAVDGCRIGEVECNDGQCFAANKYCDRVDDCPDGEDEPRHCTPCDRIFYGTVGSTYTFEKNDPMRRKVPQVCNLTFVATGDNSGGDIVQLSIHQFSLGKFHSHTHDGCPHGHMQIIEYQRQYRHGYWCGSGVGMDLYYSETPSVTILLTMNPTEINDLTSLDEYPNFYFRMTYQFLRHSDAVVRYGPPYNKKYTGIRDRTTACDVHFHSCDSSPCYVQSPNFPGMYPRNTTCYYKLKQPAAAAGTRAVLVLGQPSEFLVHIKSSILPTDVEQRQLKMYEDCYYLGDYVRVYDGNSTMSPVLITFCRGSVIPSIISSGPNMVIEFTTSAFDEPDHEVPWEYLNGFELIAKARFLPIDAIGPSCKKTVNGNKSKSGWISSPGFSLPPNTTCIWDFKGPPNHAVWLTFAHYWIEKTNKTLHLKFCAAELTIYSHLYGKKGTDLGSYCDHNLPKVCTRAHRMYDGLITRPCERNETYIIRGRHAAITQSYGESTLMKNVKFLLRYEFVDNRLPGEKLNEPCDRIIRSDRNRDTHTISGPKSVFLFGRGGRENIRCSWVLSGNEDETVQLNISSISLGDSKCKNTIVPYTQALGCRASMKPYMSLAISEWPWIGVEIPKSCICSSDAVPIIFDSISSSLAINFTVVGMQPNHDYENFTFVATYRFLKSKICEGGDRTLDSPAGKLLLKSTESSECSKKPWLLTAPVGYSLMLTLPRAALANESCASDSRLLLWIPGEETPSHVICPSADPNSVVKFIWPPNHRIQSPTHHDSNSKDKKAVARLVVQWNSHSVSSLTLQWLRLWSPFNYSDYNEFTNGELALGSGDYHTVPYPQCREWCPELNACISAEIWCDGHPHCPNGSDEAVANCILERIPWLYVATTLVTLFILLLITGSALRRRHLQEVKKRDNDNRRGSTQESFLPSKDNHRLSAFTPDFTDMDFETTV